jgi:hypothetical protein
MAELALTSLINDANLKAYYKLENANDTTPNAFNLTNNNTVSFASGKHGNGADFGSSNTDKSLSIASDLGINGGACSIVGWFKLNADIADGGAWQLVAQEDATNDILNAISYTRSGSTRTVAFRRYRQGIAGDEVTHNVNLGTTEWHHLAVTYDATNLRGYLDGALVAGPTAFSGNGAGVASASFAIGNNRGAAAGSNGYASILADDVAVFNRALSLSEIETLYKDTNNGLLAIL